MSYYTNDQMVRFSSSAIKSSRSIKSMSEYTQSWYS